jgi:hypothetical protein
MVNACLGWRVAVEQLFVGTATKRVYSPLARSHTNDEGETERERERNYFPSINLRELTEKSKKLKSVSF